jgi:hypothetical protein
MSSNCTYRPSNNDTAIRPSLDNQGNLAIPFRDSSIALSLNDDTGKITAVANWTEMIQGLDHWEPKYFSSITHDGKTDAFFVQDPNDDDKRQIVVTCDVKEGEDGTKQGGLTFISEPFEFPFDPDSKNTPITPSVVVKDDAGDESEETEGAVYNWS